MRDDEEDNDEQSAQQSTIVVVNRGIIIEDSIQGDDTNIRYSVSVRSSAPINDFFQGLLANHDY